MVGFGNSLGVCIDVPDDGKRYVARDAVGDVLDSGDQEGSLENSISADWMVDLEREVHSLVGNN